MYPLRFAFGCRANLGRVDAELGQQTSDVVAGAGGKRDAGHLTFLAIARESGLLFGESLPSASLYLGHHDRASPLSDLNHHRDVLPDRYTSQREGAVRLADGNGDRTRRQKRRARFAGHAGRNLGRTTRADEDQRPG